MKRFMEPRGPGCEWFENVIEVSEEIPEYTGPEVYKTHFDTSFKCPKRKLS